MKTDFLIIGSGPSAISAAFPLLEKGLNVLMVDGSTEKKEIQSTDNQNFGQFGEHIPPANDQSPKTRLFDLSNATQIFKNLNMISSSQLNFSGAIKRGGLSNYWGAYIAEFDDNDLNNFPIKYNDLKDSYNFLYKKIAISGSLGDDLSRFHGINMDIQKPYALYPTAASFLNKSRSIISPKIILGRSRNALASEQSSHQNACVGCNKCLLNCDYHSIFSSSQLIDDLKKFKNFTILDDFFVENLSFKNNLWLASSTGKPVLRAKKVLLGAGVLSTANLILNSFPAINKRLPLLNNPLISYPIISPSHFFRNYDVNFNALAQLALKYDYSDDHYAFGAIYSLESIPYEQYSIKLPFNLSFNQYILSIIKTGILASTLYFPSHFSSNSLHRDSSGLHINAKFTEDFIFLINSVVIKTLRKYFFRFGSFIPNFQILPIGTDNHYAGTFPMGAKGDYKTNAEGMLNNFNGLYIIDSSTFPFLPAKHLTFTVMANANRIAKILSMKGA